MFLKECKFCFLPLPLEQFKIINGRRFSKCRKCTTKYNAIWNKKNWNQVLITNRKAKLKQLYGITLEEYNKLFKIQNGICIICHLPEKRSKYNDVFKLCIDHNHETSKIRGLLCHNCNQILGHSKENISILEKCITYLKLSKENYLQIIDKDRFI